ncbi:hypothetical protein CS063_07605 [Sporanaerobium hydrogeniformans]|uniref:Uncharacterized protein n=1 Tax=Sporanaerobium hydrogeniformans TaxID=3072179 RepID=A0AC61DDW1_9FIRM|nr:hypothetical protein [Sporanaerobium hydrogeniformans]PHV70881.1 hypothetical protein CS063_07605 [Sporanaerobium hydrogeniformans]
MNYLLLLPDYQIVRLDSEEITKRYIAEYYIQDLESHAEERDLNIGELTAKNVEDMCTTLGATDDACKIYSWENILKALEDKSLGQEEKISLHNFLLDIPMEKRIKCPGDLGDLLSMTEETYHDELLIK